MPPKSLHERIESLERLVDELRITTAKQAARLAELEGTAKTPVKGKATLEEVQAFCLSIDLPASDAEWFFHKCEGNGWKNDGKPIRNWQATIRAWKTAKYLPSLKQLSSYGSKTNQQNPPGSLNAGRYSRPSTG